MIEYVSDAIVLNREPQAELDARVSLFTKRFGKFVAKARSMRKTNSKLAGHLDVGNLVRARLVEKNGLQVVDALKTAKLKAAPRHFIFLDGLLPEHEPDPQLWEALVARPFNWTAMLRLVGWDPALSSCRNCGRQRPEHFHIESQEFFCSACLGTSRIPAGKVLSIYEEDA